MSQIVVNFKDGVRRSSAGTLAAVFKVITGVWVGYILALISQTLIGFEKLMFSFVVVLTIGVVFRLLKGWSILSVVVLNLVIFLVGVLLRIYIYMGPEVPL